MRKVIFLWDNFGPLHCDRCDAVAAYFRDPSAVLGIQVFPKSDQYGWVEPRSTGPNMVTLFERREQFSLFRFVKNVMSIVRKEKVKHVFLCHYERPYIFLAAILLRLTGCSVYMMIDSKFDDVPRQLWREALKAIFVLPYSGALTASGRSADYVRFLGIRHDRIQLGYDAISVDRMRVQASGAAEPDFEARKFIIVARFVAKKNISLALRAFAIAFAENHRRKLIVCGGGELESELRAQTVSLGIAEIVEFTGFLQSSEISRLMAQSLALILPSSEEQFGQVVAEAQALSIPVVVSTACGARDELVRNAVNGFIIEPDNAEGLAEILRMLDADPALHARISSRAPQFAARGDVGRFAESVGVFVGCGAS